MSLQATNSFSPTRLENAARGSLFEYAFESLPCGAVVFDRNLTGVLRNRAARDLMPDNGNVADALADMALENRYEDWAAELRDVLEAGRPRHLDVTMKSPGRADVILCLGIHPLRSPAGEVSGGLLILEDITHRIGIERRLAVSERMAAVGKLAARVAHELNNPLDGILRYTNLALRTLKKTGGEGESADSSTLGRYLLNIRAGIQRMGDVLSELLQFSRSTPRHIDQARLHEIIEDAIRAMEGRALEADVTVFCNLDRTDLPLSHGGSLFQVFCNLIKNAIDAMSGQPSAVSDQPGAPPGVEGDRGGSPKGNSLTITARVVGNELIVTFEDTGVGLPAEVEKIFEPFFTTKAPGKGTGLGLAVSRDLIERQDGTITARRREPRGSVFVVTVPIGNSRPSACERIGGSE